MIGKEAMKIIVVGGTGTIGKAVVKKLVPTAQVTCAYSKSVEGAQTGQVYKVGY